MAMRALGYALGIALAATACSSATAPVGRPGPERAGEGGAGNEGGGGEGDDEKGGVGEGDAGGESSGVELAVVARAVLSAHCGGCHRGVSCGSTSGGFGEMFDVDAMIACGHVVPGAPAASTLWKRIKGDSMPPTGRLSDAQKEAVRVWIDAGAPPLPGG
jgi:hypothetical protein